MNALQALYAQREQFLKDIENWQRLQNLQALSDWQHVIENGWLRDACVQSVGDGVNPALDERLRQYALDIARATGFLRHYLDAIMRKGQAAQEGLNSLQAAIDAEAGENV